MSTKPRFYVTESWDNSGDVDVWFDDDTSQDLRNRVGQELNEMIPRLHPYAKSVYHVEALVDYIFYNMLCQGHLQKGSGTDHWIWSK